MAVIRKFLPEYGADVLIECSDTLAYVAYPTRVLGRESENDVHVAHVLQALCLEVLDLRDELRAMNEEKN